MHRKQRTITCKLLFLQLIFLFLLPYQHHTIFYANIYTRLGKKGFQKLLYCIFACKKVPTCMLLHHAPGASAGRL